MKRGKIESNVWKLSVIAAIRSFTVFIPIIVLFFKENGLSIKEIFILQAVFSVAAILLEIPSGYFSDLFGKKISIVLGSIIATLGFILYSFSGEFWGFLISELILGIGVSFISGSDSALLYDTLLAGKKEDKYQKVEGKILSVRTFSESIASIIGGFIALVSLRFPLYFEAFISVFAIPIAFSLVDPGVNREKPDCKKIFNEAKYFIFSEKKVKWSIIYSSLVGTSTLLMFWLFQPYLIEMEVSVSLFGVALSISLLVASLFSWNASRIESFLGKKKVFISLIFLPIIGYFTLGVFWFVGAGLFILIFYVARGLNNPVTLDYINGLISSEVRATVLSVRNLLTRLLFAIMGPLVGWISDVFSLRLALLFSGVLFVVFGIVSIFYMMKYRII